MMQCPVRAFLGENDHVLLPRTARGRRKDMHVSHSGITTLLVQVYVEVCAWKWSDLSIPVDRCARGGKTSTFLATLDRLHKVWLRWPDCARKRKPSCSTSWTARPVTPSLLRHKNVRTKTHEIGNQAMVVMSKMETREFNLPSGMCSYACCRFSMTRS